MVRTPVRLILLASMAMTMTGCSRAYDLVAEHRNGVLVFLPEPGTNNPPECVTSVKVRAEEPLENDAPVGDVREAAEQYNVVWSHTVRDPCANDFPITYGEALAGETIMQNLHVSPQALQPGAIYLVSISTSSSAYGSGRFRIERDGQVTNLNGFFD